MPRDGRKRRSRRGRHAIGAPVEYEPLDIEEPDLDTSDPEEIDEPEEDFTSRRGTRRRTMKRRRLRRAVVRMGGGALLGAVVAGAVIVGPGLFSSGDRQGSNEPPGSVAKTKSSAITTLVFGTREKQGVDPEALWLMLFSYDADKGEASGVQLPAHTAAEIPGRGLETFNRAYASGGIPLLLVSVENMLGIQVDRFLELSDRDARVLFSATGPITVNVPEELRIPAGSNRARIVFGAGTQRLSAPFLVRLLYTRGLDVDDLDFIARHISFWGALFDRFDNDPPALAAAITKSEGALGESDATAGQLAAFFRGIADLPPLGLKLTSLPVRPVSAGDDELYATDADEVSRFVAQTFGHVRRQQDEVRVQILNGNGVPGIGQKVAERLIGRGFRVILSGNARRLNYEKTLIVTYDRSAEGQALAERARELIQVGQVQVSAQQQGIVDLTIVIGEDFLSTL
jgi:anionic cell wall polymer biosynthesis LytR-Cps2A-Psr (LCP) family protein